MGPFCPAPVDAVERLQRHGGAKQAALAKVASHLEVNFKVHGFVGTADSREHFPSKALNRLLSPSRLHPSPGQLQDIN